MFWFLAAFTVVLVPLLFFVVPESPVRVKDRIDPLGAVLLAGGPLLVLLYLDNGQHWGWLRPQSRAWLVVGLVLLVSFFIVESRVRRPMIDMKLLLDRKVSVVLLMVIVGMGITGVQPLAMGYMVQTPNNAELSRQITGEVVARAAGNGNPIPPDQVHVTFDPGYSYGDGFGMLEFALHVGMWAGLVGMVVGPVGGALARRVGPRVLAIVAFAVLAVSGAGFLLVSYSWVTYLVLYLLAGVGFGCIYAAVPNLLIDAVPQKQQGITTGLLGVTMSLGTGIAMAISTAMLNANPVVAHIDVAGHQSSQVLEHVFADRGYFQSFCFVLATTLVALCIAVAMRHGRKPATGGL